MSEAVHVETKESSLQARRPPAWEMPDREEFSDYPKLGVAGKKKILGLNAAKLYDIEVPAEYQIKDEASAAAQDDAQLVDDRSQPVAGA